MNLSHAPVGVFDSGVGGFSVLRHIHEQLPGESIHYFADSGFAPYGDKTEADILTRTRFAAHYLLQQGVKALVVACNTATANAIADLRVRYPELILVGVEPGLKPAANVTRTGCIGVLATSRTLASEKYQQLCQQLQQSHQVRFINQACPELAAQIERGELESEVTLNLLATYLQPFFNTPIDTLVLGCTHYPFVAHHIQRLISAKHDTVQLIDTGIAVASQLRRLLEQHSLLNLSKARPTQQFTTSGNANQLRLAISRLLQLDLDNCQIHHVNSSVLIS